MATSDSGGHGRRKPPQASTVPFVGRGEVQRVGTASDSPARARSRRYAASYCPIRRTRRSSTSWGEELTLGVLGQPVEDPRRVSSSPVAARRRSLQVRAGVRARGDRRQLAVHGAARASIAASGQDRGRAVEGRAALVGRSRRSGPRVRPRRRCYIWRRTARAWRRSRRGTRPRGPLPVLPQGGAVAELERQPPAARLRPPGPVAEREARVQAEELLGRGGRGQDRLSQDGLGAEEGALAGAAAGEERVPPVSAQESGVAEPYDARLARGREGGMAWRGAGQSSSS